MGKRNKTDEQIAREIIHKMADIAMDYIGEPPNVVIGAMMAYPINLTMTQAPNKAAAMVYLEGVIIRQIESYEEKRNKS